MKKLLLSINAMLVISAIYSQSIVSIDTLKISLCKEVTYSNKVQETLSLIPNIKQSTYIGFDSTERLNLVRGIIDGLNKTFTTNVFSKLSVVLAAYYEKPNIGEENYISIQEWQFQSLSESDDAFGLLKKINNVSLEYFTFFPHMVWIKKGSSLFLIDTTLKTNNSNINEVIQIMKKNIDSNSIIVLN